MTDEGWIELFQRIPIAALWWIYVGLEEVTDDHRFRGLEDDEGETYEAILYGRRMLELAEKVWPLRSKEERDSIWNSHDEDNQ